MPVFPAWATERSQLSSIRPRELNDASFRCLSPAATLAAHRTQINPWLASLPPEWLDRLLGHEAFGLVRGELSPGARQGLLEGLSVTER